MKEAKSGGFWRDCAIFLAVMAASIALAFILSKSNDDNNPFAAPLFILAVALISRYTEGYRYGIAASVLGVFCVNYMFTYPFFEFDLSLSGYPLTFTVMLIVSVTISALSTRLKKQERLRFDAQNEKMRANLLRGVSHDIRTPLASILGASSTLLENKDLDESDREELLLEINNNANWLIRTTENMLSITKFNQQGVVIKKTPEVAEEIIGSAIVSFHKNYPGMPVVVEKPDEILFVPMDATLIERVLINLFENVVIHAKNATCIKLTVSIEGDYALFTVTDDGEGIPPDVLEHIFDGQLTLSERSRIDDHRNMGIGLSICQSIINAHSGSMDAKNEEMGRAPTAPSGRLREGARPMSAEASQAAARRDDQRELRTGATISFRLPLEGKGYGD